MKDPISKLVNITVKFVIGILSLDNNITFSLRQECRRMVICYFFLNLSLD